MLKKLIIFFFILSPLCIYSKIELNDFLLKNDSPLLNDLFTINVGIMKFKNRGNINKIDPIDSQNVVNQIKSILDDVTTVKLKRKAALIKAIELYLTKLKEEEKEIPAFLKNKLMFSDINTDPTLTYELFLQFRKNKDFNPIAKLWFENLENPFYNLNVSIPFDRVILPEENICINQKSNEKGPLDILIHGEIEKIDNLYFITIIVYSNLLKSRIYEISYAVDSDNLSNKTIEKFSSMIHSLFLIDYAALTVDTEDDDTSIYLNSNYIGKKKVLIEYLLPGSYIVTLKKENYEDKIINVSLNNFEEKHISGKVEKKEELQVFNFYIEPLGTKIFINSIFIGRTPFKRALPKGKYVISANNDLYESYRYVLSVDKVDDEEKDIAFHLRSKDPVDFFKLRKYGYYAAFWNFTFSLVVTIPLLVITVDQWNRYIYLRTTEMLNTTYILYGFSAVMITHTVLSLGLLFYTLANYIRALEKKDFIPILEFYHNIQGKDEIKIGMEIKL